MNKKEKKDGSVQGVIAKVLFITLLLSLLFSLFRFFTSPAVITEGEPFRKVKSDYLLMSMQCASGLLVMMLPTFISRKFRLVVPNFMCVLYYIFLYLAVFLGEIFSFYYKIPYWDVLLHTMSGAMLGALGFILVDWLNQDARVKLSASPVFVSLFAFSFALAIGAMWEIYEFSFDAIFGLNMQKFRLENGAGLVGQAALVDTMKDIITDAVAAMAVSVIGYVKNIRRLKKGGQYEQSSRH